MLLFYFLQCLYLTSHLSVAINVAEYQDINLDVKGFFISVLHQKSKISCTLNAENTLLPFNKEIYYPKLIHTPT